MDRALKVIAIFETRGIVSKEFAGEMLFPVTLKSDLLNQLELWEDQKRNSRLVSGKKAALAREIYMELKKRLADRKVPAEGMPPVKGSLSVPEQKHLFRAILSGFCDGRVFQGRRSLLAGGRRKRQIERTSILNQTRPEMVAGLPFDLIINREDPKTGSKEERYLPLVTFCSAFPETAGRAQAVQL